MFTFLEYDGIPWNDNNAEHAMKEFAEFRQKNDYLFTKASLKELLILLSIRETCKYKGINFLSFLISREKGIDGFNIVRKN